MFLFVFILTIKIFILYCYKYQNNIIDIYNYEKKYIQFNKNKTFYLFKYHYNHLDNLFSSSFIIKIFPKGKNYSYFIKKDNNILKKNNTLNTIELIDYNSYLINIENATKGEYFIGIKYFYDLNTSITIYSSESPHLVSNIFYNNKTFNSNKNYIFFIPQNHSKFIKFGVKSFNNMNINLIITQDNLYNKIYEKHNNYFEDYLKLNNNHSYYFYFSSNISENKINEAFLYLMQSEFSQMIFIKKNKKDFYFIPIINEVNLLLNVSKKDNKLIFEFDNIYNNFFNHLFIFYGYSNINNIKNNERILLNISNKK